MYGLIGKMLAKPGHRDEIIAILLSAGAMPGCRLYLVAADPDDANAIWISEVWDTQAEHDASLQLPQVQAAIAQVRMLRGPGRARRELYRWRIDFISSVI